MQQLCFICDIVFQLLWKTIFISEQRCPTLSQKTSATIINWPCEELAYSCCQPCVQLSGHPVPHCSQAVLNGALWAGWIKHRRWVVVQAGCRKGCKHTGHSGLLLGSFILPKCPFQSPHPTWTIGEISHFKDLVWRLGCFQQSVFGSNFGRDVPVFTCIQYVYLQEAISSSSFLNSSFISAFINTFLSLSVWASPEKYTNRKKETWANRWWQISLPSSFCQVLKFWHTTKTRFYVWRMSIRDGVYKLQAKKKKEVW